MKKLLAHFLNCFFFKFLISILSKLLNSKFPIIPKLELYFKGLKPLAIVATLKDNIDFSIYITKRNCAKNKA